jgi:hypothetical protein
VDVVLDPVSADTQRRSFGVLKKDGILVALTEEPRQNLARENGVRATMIGVKPDGRRLADIGKLIDDGKLRPIVQAVLPLEQAKEALALSRSRHVAGKIVLTIGTISSGTEVAKRDIAAGAIHATLERLEAKGLIRSRLGLGTLIRDGRARRFYSQFNMRTSHNDRAGKTTARASLITSAAMKGRTPR